MKLPPKAASRFLRWFCREDYVEEIEGDLTEVFRKECNHSIRKANWKFAWRVLRTCRPEFWKPLRSPQLTNTGMYKSNFKIAWRNLLRSKGYSAINVAGLSIGMTVVLFISLWIYDELTFNTYHDKYDRITQVHCCGTNTGTSEMYCGQGTLIPLANALRTSYPQLFKRVLTASWISDFALVTAEKKINKTGFFIETGALDMLSLRMLKGSTGSLDNTNSVVLSQSTALALFGSDDPINKTVTIHGRMEASVTGVYEDLPRNSEFADIQFIAPWSLWLSANEWLQRKENDWDNHVSMMYAELQPDVAASDANAAIKDLYATHVPADFYKTIERFHPYAQLLPMSKWHLFNEFENGNPVKGRITYVWLFGTIGVFVLGLACINFVNLSTARSEKRAREVGVRKTMGSLKRQLVIQFMSESLMVVLLAFALSVASFVVLRPLFNQLVDKDLHIPFDQPMFWVAAIGFVVFTAMVAGIYPAFYLSSFQPARVLKGKVLVGQMTGLPRRIMVTLQFTVSIVLAISTWIVYDQIQFAQNRPIGYDRASLISMNLNQSYAGKVTTVQNELLRTGVVAHVATASSPVTAIWNSTSGYSWPGKDPALDAEFAICNVTSNFGNTVRWDVLSGRDFSQAYATDSLDAIIVNEAAVKYMGLKDPVGQEFLDVDEKGNKVWSRTIVGVVKDMVMESPYDDVRPMLYFYHPNALNVLHVRLDPTVSALVALQKIEEVINKVVPDAVFNFSFVDANYAKKFSQEQRIGKLSATFAFLAMVICCLGLFGLISFVAEQRTKEIGIRKVLGATVFGIWKLLSKEFAILVLVSSVVAIPISYYIMDDWLHHYVYRTSVSIWIVLIACLIAAVITLLTVSFQSIKAARANPTKSLRAE